MLIRLTVLLCVLSFPKLQASDFYNIGAVDLPPLYRVESGIVVGGTCYEKLVFMFNQANLKFKFTTYPISRLYRSLGSGEIEVFVGVKSVPSYEGKVIFGEKELLSLELAVFSKPGTSATLSSDLIGRSIIVIRGYVYGGILDELRKMWRFHQITRKFAI